MRIIAHRCGPELHPQLTIASAKDALSVGAAYVEMDVRHTSDGLPVVNHDDNAGMLFGTPEKIAELISAEFLAKRHKNAAAYPAHSVEHFMQSGVRRILFHCKIGGEPLRQVFDLCRKYGIEEEVVFGVQRVEDVHLVKAYNPAMKVLAFMPGADTNEGTAQNIRAFAAAGADFIRLWEHWELDALFPVVKACGKQIWIMANNPDVEPLDCGYTSAAKLRAYRDAGVDGILVNNPSFCMITLQKA